MRRKAKDAMKILITGAKGFIGRNLAAHLRAVGQADLLEYDVDTPHERLAEYAAGCDFVYHLAGINRPVDPADFMRGNADFTAELLSLLRRRTTPTAQARRRGRSSCSSMAAR